MTPITVSGTSDSVETTAAKNDFLVELDFTAEYRRNE